MPAWTRKKLTLILSAIGLLFILILFNSSFRLTIARHRAIRNTQAELEKVSHESHHLRNEIAKLDHATEQENMVRRDLGYIRPGEKEVRFLNSSPENEK